jgi:hypothetical protein
MKGSSCKVMDMSRSRTQIISEITTAERVVQAERRCAQPVSGASDTPVCLSDESV